MSAIRVLHGAPDDCELAALIAVLQSVRRQEPGDRAEEPVWRARESWTAGASAWRLSGLPR
jgi:hypothetical protein